MTRQELIANRTSQSWELEDIHISHNLMEYDTLGTQVTKVDNEYVRLHFGLQGDYSFKFAQLNQSYSLTGHHNNIMSVSYTHLTLPTTPYV